MNIEAERLTSIFSSYPSRGQQFFGLVYYQTTHDLVALQPKEKELQEGRPLEELPAWLLPRLVESGVFQDQEINQVGMTRTRHQVGIK